MKASWKWISLVLIVALLLPLALGVFGVGSVEAKGKQPPLTTPAWLNCCTQEECNGVPRSGKWVTPKTPTRMGHALPLKVKNRR